MRVNDWVSILVFLGALVYFVRVKGPQEHVRVDERRPDAPGHAPTGDADPVARASPIRRRSGRDVGRDGDVRRTRRRRTRRGDGRPTASADDGPARARRRSSAVRTAVVVGAGVGGLAAAGALVRSGWHVTLLERGDRLRGNGRGPVHLAQRCGRAARARPEPGRRRRSRCQTGGIRRPDGRWLVGRTRGRPRTPATAGGGARRRPARHADGRARRAGRDPHRRSR